MVYWTPRPDKPEPYRVISCDELAALLPGVTGMLEYWNIGSSSEWACFLKKNCILFRIKPNPFIHDSIIPLFQCDGFTIAAREKLFSQKAKALPLRL